MAETPTILATARVQVRMPDEFNFSKPEAWPMWVKRFDRYLSLSNLTTKPDKEKIDLICYCMGIKAEEILQLVLPEMNDSTTFATVKEKFDGYFKRCKLNSRVTQPDESVDASVTGGQTETELNKRSLVRMMKHLIMHDVNINQDFKLEFIVDYNKLSPKLGAYWSTTDYYNDCSLPYPLVDYAEYASTFDEFIEKYPRVVIETSSKAYSPDTFGQRGTGSFNTLEFETSKFSHHEFKRENILYFYEYATWQWSVQVEMGVGFKTVNTKLYLQCLINGWIYSVGHPYRTMELGFRVTKITFHPKNSAANTLQVN